MKQLMCCLIAVCIAGSVLLPLMASAEGRVDEDSPTIDQELSQLRGRVAELERRVDEFELTQALLKARHSSSLLPADPFEAEPRQVWPVDLEEHESVVPRITRRHVDRIPPNGTVIGAIVFPGIDAPPLTPMHEVRWRRGE